MVVSLAILPLERGLADLKEQLQIFELSYSSHFEFVDVIYSGLEALLSAVP